MSNKPRICLNMIVKNESAVIGRCLDSLLPLIDTWVIVDTGSTDGTQALIENKLAHLPGELHERPWVNFGHNRSEAVALAQGKADYVLFFDADDVLQVSATFVMPKLTADAYQLWLEENDTRYTRMMLVSTRIKWRWEGVVHEYPHGEPTPTNVEILLGLTIASVRGGARSADPQRFKRDAELLESAVAAKPDDPRSVFYLAQSYRDAGETQRAFDTYLRRAAMPGWDEENWYALFQAARLAEALKRPWPEVTDRYLAAFQLRPQRAEPLVELARGERERNQLPRAFVFAMAAHQIARPPGDILFVDESCYQWRAMDELAVAAYWVGRYDLSRDMCRALLAGNGLPTEHRDRVKANMGFALDKLAVK
jgi:glycosyltransferase involved in cell wall biosynthesis